MLGLLIVVRGCVFPRRGRGDVARQNGGGEMSIHRFAGPVDGGAPEPLLEAANVAKRFGGVVANDGVSLQVMPGEIVGFNRAERLRQKHTV